MADENNTNIQPDTGNPPIPDFLNMDGGISADSLQAPQPNANGVPDFANAPGAISVEALEKAEQEMAQNQPAFQPVNIPTPPAPGQPMQMGGASGFDANAMNNFFNKYNGGSANSVDYTKPPAQQQAAPTGISNRQQAAILNDLLSGGTGAGAVPQPTPQRNRQQPVEEEKRPMPGTEMQCGCACNSTCKNTSCVFYGKTNFMSINDIIEDEIQARIEYLIDSGELEVRKFEHRKSKLKSNKYLSDISDSLLGLEV